MPRLTGPDGVVLMGHGSRDLAGAEEFLALARAVAAAPPLHGTLVRPGWLEFAGDRVESIQQAFGQLVEGGARSIAAVPLILFAGGHGADDMPAQVCLAQQRYPSAHIRMADLVGIDDCLLACLAARAGAATSGLPTVPAREESCDSRGAQPTRRGLPGPPNQAALRRTRRRLPGSTRRRTHRAPPRAPSRAVGIHRQPVAYRRLAKRRARVSGERIVPAGFMQTMAQLTASTRAIRVTISAR